MLNSSSSLSVVLAPVLRELLSAAFDSSSEASKQLDTLQRTAETHESLGWPAARVLILELREQQSGGAPFTSAPRGRSDGRYFLNLELDGPRLWCQLIFQFAHELAHVICYTGAKSLRHKHRHQWFEEAVCHAASIHALREYRDVEKLYPGQALAMQQYAEQQEGYRLPANDTLAAWYRRNREELSCVARVNTEESRRQQAVLSAWLRRELGIRELLSVAPFLNLHRSDDMSFSQYLRNWRSNCPPALKSRVGKIIKAFYADSSKERVKRGEGRKTKKQHKERALKKSVSDSEEEGGGVKRQGGGGEASEEKRKSINPTILDTSERIKKGLTSYARSGGSKKEAVKKATEIEKEEKQVKDTSSSPSILSKAANRCQNMTRTEKDLAKRAAKKGAWVGVKIAVTGNPLHVADMVDVVDKNTVINLAMDQVDKIDVGKAIDVSSETAVKAFRKLSSRKKNEEEEELSDTE